MLRLVGFEDSGAVDPTSLNMLSRDEAVWGDRFARDQEHKAPPRGRTLSSWAEDYLGERLASVIANPDRKRPKTYVRVRSDVGTFVRFFGPEALPAEAVRRWPAWELHVAAAARDHEANPVRGCGWAASTAKTLYASIRSFMKWLHRKRAISELPESWDQPASFFHHAPPTKTFSAEEVIRLVRGPAPYSGR
jgi:hypothetical protein